MDIPVVEVVAVGFSVVTFVESEVVVVYVSLSSVAVDVVGSVTGGLKKYVVRTPVGV